MDISLLKDIVAVFENSSLSTMELETENIKLKLKREISAPARPVTAVVQPPVPTAPPQAEKTRDYVKSPLVGTFYAAPAQDSPPFVQLGSFVNRGDTLCIIEAMKVMNEIKAPKSGWITDIRVKNGDMVRYDDDLMAIGDKQ